MDIPIPSFTGLDWLASPDFLASCLCARFRIRLAACSLLGLARALTSPRALRDGVEERLLIIAINNSY